MLVHCMASYPTLVHDYYDYDDDSPERPTVGAPDNISYDDYDGNLFAARRRKVASSVVSLLPRNRLITAGLEPVLIYSEKS